MSISFEGAWGPTERRRKVSTMILVCKGLPLLCLLLLIPVLLRAGAVDEVITDTKRTHSPVGTLDGNPRRDQDRVVVDSDELGAIKPERAAERTLNEDSTSAPTGRPSSSSAPTSSLAPTATKLPAGEPCSDDFECMPNTSGQQACGHTVYNVTSPVICCPTGAKLVVFGESYCVDQVDGAPCSGNAMCASGLCAENVCVEEVIEDFGDPSNTDETDPIQTDAPTTGVPSPLPTPPPNTHAPSTADDASVEHEEQPHQDDPPGPEDPAPTATGTSSPMPSAAPTGPTSTSAPSQSPAPTEPRLSAYEPCSNDFECMPNNSGLQGCGHAVYSDAAPVICCPTGAKVVVLGKSFCVDQGIGAPCGDNNMCTSGTCGDDNTCVRQEFEFEFSNR